MPITLVVEGKDGKREALQVQATVRPVNAASAGGAHGGMQMMH